MKNPRSGSRDRERGGPVFAENAVREVTNGRIKGIIVKFVSVAKSELASWCRCCEAQRRWKYNNGEEREQGALKSYQRHCWRMKSENEKNDYRNLMVSWVTNTGWRTYMEGTNLTRSVGTGQCVLFFLLLYKNDLYYFYFYFYYFFA